MKIILLKDVSKVGRKYEVKNISDGYAANMLIPNGLAIAATPEAIKRGEAEKKKSEGENKVREDLILKNLKDLDGVTIEMTEKANEKGHLFAGVHKAELIPEILKQTRLEVSDENIILDKPIKEVGMHEVEVIAGNKSIKFNLNITGGK